MEISNSTTKHPQQKTKSSYTQYTKVTIFEVLTIIKYRNKKKKKNHKFEP